MEPSASLILFRISGSRGCARAGIGDEVVVDLQELTRERLALEQVRHLRLDAFVTSDDRGDGRRRRNGDEQAVAKADLSDPSFERFEALRLTRRGAPQVKLRAPLRRTRLREGLVGAKLFG